MITTATPRPSEAFDDFSIPGRGPGLVLGHAYNSLRAAAPDADGPLGFAWTNSYNMALSVGPLGVVTVRQESGAEVSFYPDGAGNFEAPPRAAATLQRNATDGSYTFVRRAQTTIRFSASGQLLSIADRNGAVNATTLQYVGAKLDTVSDPAGRKLHFSWVGTHVSTVSDDSSPARTVRFAYTDGNGNLTDYTDVANGSWQFTYYPGTHLLKTLRRPRQAGLPSPKVTTNVYDSGGRVVSQTDELQRQTLIEYTAAGAAGTTKVTDPKGNVTVEEYQNLVRTSLTRGYATPGAAIWRFESDATLGTTKLTDPDHVGGAANDDHVTRATYDAHGNMVGAVDGLAKASFATYNDFDEPLTVTDANDMTTTFGYDTQGNLESTSAPLVGTTAVRTTTYDYDPAHPGDLLTVTDARNKQWQQTYDAYGNLASAQDPLADTTRYGYDPATGWLTSTVSPRGSAAGVGTGCVPPAMGCTRYGHDAWGHVTSTVDPNGHQTLAHYDADAHLDSSTDANTNPTTVVYDDADQAVRTNRADTTSLRTDYWPDGIVKATFDGANHPTSYAYDPLGRLTSVTDPDNRITRYGYDPAGNPVTKADPGGICPAWPIASPPALSAYPGCTVSGYDAADRLTSVTYSDPATRPVTSITYDNVGRRTDMADGTGTSHWRWDSLGRLTSFTDGANHAMGYGYANLRDPATTVTYPAGPVTRVFDDAKRMVSVRDWVGNLTTITPDADSNVATIAPPAATATVDTFGYDRADQVSSATAKVGTTTVASATYGRDNADQVNSQTATTPADNHSYTYTLLNQLETLDGSPFAYDGADNLAGFPDGETQHFDFANQLKDASGAVPDVTWGSTGDIAVPANYTGAGTTQAVFRPANGTWYVRGVSETQWGQAGDVPVPADYDGDGRADIAVWRPSTGQWLVKGISDTVWGQGGTTPDVPVVGDYNGDGRADIAVWRPSTGQWLVRGQLDVVWGAAGDKPVIGDYNGDGTTDLAVWRASTGQWLVRGQLDVVWGATGDMAVPGDYNGDGRTDLGVFRPGNGTWYLRGIAEVVWGQAGDTPVVAPYDRDRKADVAVWHPAAGAPWYVRPSTTAAFGYDTRGNRSSTTPASGPALGYGYDQANRLVSAPGATYAYNGDGIRTAKTVGATTSSFTWDPSGSLPLVVDDGTNYYIYGPGGLPLEHIDRSGAVTWYHHDQLGSTRTLTTSTGAVVGTATYDPYGRPTAASGRQSPLGFAGEYTDAETGFVYLRARYYDPVTTQFLTRDPLVALTGSAYGYVEGNPINGTDASGLSFCLGPIEIGDCGPRKPEQLINAGAPSGLGGPLINVIAPDFGGGGYTILPELGGKPGYTPALDLGQCRVFAKQPPRENTPDQDALIQIARSKKQLGGVTPDKAEILGEWRIENQLPGHGPMVHDNRDGFGGTTPHINVGPVKHIPVQP